MKSGTFGIKQLLSWSSLNHSLDLDAQYLLKYNFRYLCLSASSPKSIFENLQLKYLWLLVDLLVLLQD